MELQSVLFEIEEAICRPDPEPILTEMIHQVISLCIYKDKNVTIISWDENDILAITES